MLPLSPAIRVAIAVGIGSLAAPVASPAPGEDSSKLYAGAGLAVTDFKSDHEGIGYGATPVGWQVYGGWQARELMAVEVAIERLSGIEAHDVRGSGVERLRISADDTSVAVRGVLSLSLQDVLRVRQNITVFGTVGVARSLEERSVLELTTARVSSVAERDWAPVLGAGVTFDLARVRLRTHVQSASRGTGTLTSVGVAAEFRF